MTDARRAASILGVYSDLVVGDWILVEGWIKVERIEICPSDRRPYRIWSRDWPRDRAYRSRRPFDLIRYSMTEQSRLTRLMQIAAYL